MAERSQLKHLGQIPVAALNTILRKIQRLCPYSEGKNPIYTAIAISAKSMGGKVGRLLSFKCSWFPALFKPQNTGKAAEDSKSVNFVGKCRC